MPTLYSGLALCGVLALSASWLEAQALGAVFGGAVVAMLLGMGLAQVLPGERLEAGCDFVVRVILPLGIVLLGARVRLEDLAALGMWGLGMGVGVIALSCSVFLALARWGRLAPRLAILLALGNGICGGSAIAAAAPVLGARRDEIAASISAVMIAGTIGTLALPFLGHRLDLSPEVFGLWAGLSLQQTPQVVAAGLSYGPEAGAIATSAKLVRIALLTPVIFGLGLAMRRRTDAPACSLLHHIPGFLWGFLLLSAFSTLSLLPQIGIGFEPGSWLGAWHAELSVREVAAQGSQACMTLAMAAIGLQTRRETLARVGPGALGAALLGAVVVSTFVGLVVAV